MLVSSHCGFYSGDIRLKLLDHPERFTTKHYELPTRDGSENPCPALEALVAWASVTYIYCSTAEQVS